MGHVCALGEANTLTKHEGEGKSRRTSVDVHGGTTSEVDHAGSEDVLQAVGQPPTAREGTVFCKGEVEDPAGNRDCVAVDDPQDGDQPDRAEAHHHHADDALGLDEAAIEECQPRCHQQHQRRRDQEEGGVSLIHCVPLSISWKVHRGSPTRRDCASGTPPVWGIEVSPNGTLLFRGGYVGGVRVNIWFRRAVQNSPKSIS